MVPTSLGCWVGMEPMAMYLEFGGCRDPLHLPAFPAMLHPPAPKDPPHNLSRRSLCSCWNPAPKMLGKNGAGGGGGLICLSFPLGRTGFQGSQLQQGGGLHPRAPCTGLPAWRLQLGLDWGGGGWPAASAGLAAAVAPPGTSQALNSLCATLGCAGVCVMPMGEETPGRGGGRSHLRGGAQRGARNGPPLPHLPW